ncbi:MAG: ATP-binding protein [Deltaproteobacteria bacterium]|nr:ATP-binding protein [Deltaproteobacteria bacterium]
MIISVASGKGGTGKTTVAVNLALSLNDAQLVDCDVEEPNVHLFIMPEITEKKSAYIPIPEVDKDTCNYCDICRQVCAYNAIVVIPPRVNKKGTVLIYPELCHGCGACTLLCPQKAMIEIDKEIGIIEIGGKGNLQFIQGKLNIGEAMSPPLIRQVKKHINTNKTVIIDAPPGTSCPVITAVKGSDFCVLVTEPTPFGLNDLALTVDVVRELKVPFGVVINRAAIGNDGVEQYCEKEGIPILMKIPFDRKIAEAYSQGTPMVTILPDYKISFQGLFDTITMMTQKV